jgi:hypothetical protein
MVLKKLKFLLKPPIPLLLGNGVAFGLLLSVARVSGWGVVALVVYALYVYTTRVRGRGNVGWTFFMIVLISYLATTGLLLPGGDRFAALTGGIVLICFLSAIEYRVKNFSVFLQMCNYALLGLFALWWMERAAISGWVIMPLLFFGIVYGISRDRVRFVEHFWNKEFVVWYVLLAYITTQYLWGLSLLPLSIIQTTALFLIFFVVADETIFIARSGTINKKTAIANALWYVGSSVVILLMGKML